MSWVNEKCISFMQMLCIKIFKLISVRMPKHVAIIMDGNRRFARRGGLKTRDGHSKGFDKLAEALKWCIELGVKELTVYAFSIENFKRSEEEVNALAELACSKLRLLLNSIDNFNSFGVSVHLVGCWSLLSEEIRDLSSRAMLATRDNDRLKLNVACAYTGRDEISRAASALVDAVRNKELFAEDIDEDLISQTLDLGDPDLLIRTSGEVRLSDFMVWQVSRTVLYFTEVLWPDFSLYGLLGAFVHYQMYAPVREARRKNNERKNAFLHRLEKRRWQDIENNLKHPISKA